VGQPRHEQGDVSDTDLPAPARPGTPPQKQRDRVRIRLRRGLRAIAPESLVPQETIGDGHDLKILIQHRPVPLSGRQSHRECRTRLPRSQMDSRERLPATSTTPTENRRATRKITRFGRHHATGQKPFG
jgi:hypothetical protein